MKITVLTGAGASYDSGKVMPSAPPLGSGLYNALKLFDPPYMEYLSSNFGEEDTNNFEKKMYQICTSNKQDNVIELNAKLALYFSEFKPSVTNNVYIELFRLIKGSKHEFIYSTLNYDCIADICAKFVDLNIHYEPNKKIKNSLLFCKLHGSCNFWISNTELPVGYIRMTNMTSEIVGTVCIVQCHNVRNFMDKFGAGGPVMAFYMKDKPVVSSRQFIQAIQAHWQKEILRSDKVIIIGARPNFEDKHIWDYLATTKAEVGYVGGKESFSTFIRDIPTKSNVCHLTEKFSNSINRIKEFIG